MSKNTSAFLPQRTRSRHCLLLGLISLGRFAILTSEGSHGSGGGETGGLEAINGLYYRRGGPGTLGAQWISGYRKPNPAAADYRLCAAGDGERKALAELGKKLRRQALAEVATLRFATGWAHSLPGTAWWATRVPSSPHGMSAATEQGVLMSAPQRETVSLAGYRGGDSGASYPKEHQCVRMRR